MNKNGIKISFIYVGTVIGAGFASGREIIDFFGVYGTKGIFGMLVSGILFSLIGSLLLLKIYNNKIKGFNQLIENVFGKKKGYIIENIMIISLYTGFSVMVAGSGAIFEQELGLSFDIGIIVMVICCFLVFLFSLEGLSFINTILVPLLIVGIIFTSFYLNIGVESNFTNIEGVKITHRGNFISSSILYLGSNSLIIIVIFSSLLPMINSKKTAIAGGILGGTILTILGMAILTSMLTYYSEVQRLEIPMLGICNYIGKGYRKSYSAILWIAMFTTALANGFGFMDRIPNGKNKLLILALFCISALPLSKVGFSNLVAIIYPIFGYIGIIVIIRILAKTPNEWHREYNKNKK